MIHELVDFKRREIEGGERSHSFGNSCARLDAAVDNFGVLLFELLPADLHRREDLQNKTLVRNSQ